MKKRIFSIWLMLILAALACNLPSGANVANATDTAAAATIAAQQTEGAVNQIETSETPTLTPESTDTSTPPAPTIAAQTVTDTPLPCNAATFVKDVTFPDGSQILSGTAFTKTWRFKNVGTCTWNSSYQIIFDHGAQMGGPDSQSLTSGTVPPNATVDISVNLTAPSSPDHYRGYWQFRDPSGVLFGLSTGSFWVDIQDVAPTATNNPSPTPSATLPPAIAAAQLSLISGQSGSVRSDGTVLTAPNVGDTDTNTSSQAFLTFDMSSIPSGVTLVGVQVDFSSYDTLGSPFSLGNLRMYAQNYGSLGAGDYYSGATSGAFMRWGSTGDLTSVIAPPDSSLLNYLQSKVGSSQVQFRVQFNENADNGNNVADMVRLGTSIKLTVSYTAP